MQLGVALLLICSTCFLFSCSGDDRGGQYGSAYQQLILYPLSETGGVGGTGTVFSGSVAATSMPAQVPLEGTPDPSCSGARIIESDVRGTSMIPLYQDGDIIQYSSGYYLCHEVNRNDIVIYHHPRERLIKRVVGVAGDKWQYSSGKIIINGKTLKNSEGSPYDITSKILDLYVESYPTIPKDTYMILGNQISGTLDSSRFGLIAKQDITGKVISKEEKK